MSVINPINSALNVYSYQQLHIFQLCMEWLAEPEKFNSITFRYRNNDVSNPEIDHITVECANRRCIFYQTWYKKNPKTNEWDFNQLIEKGLYKWIISYGQLNTPHMNSFRFITNANTGPDVYNCLNGQKIDLEKIELRYPELTGKLKMEITDYNLVSNFFKHSTFIFNHSEHHSINGELKSYLYDQFKINETGANNLLLFIAFRKAKEYTKVLTLSSIRKHLSRDNRQPLEQDSIVPSDFEFFDQQIHNNLLHELNTTNQGFKILSGKPGSGKSTYLVKLCDLLEKERAAVGRHHYYIDLDHYTKDGLFNSEQIKEILLVQIKIKESDVLEKAGVNPGKHITLRNLISKLAVYYHKTGKVFLVSRSWFVKK